MTASQNFVASNGESRNPLYEGCFEGETQAMAVARRHWALAAQELALACATNPLAAAVPQQEEPTWFAVPTPGADFDVSFVQSMEEALQLNDGDPDAESHITPLYTTPQVSPPQARVPLTEERLKKLDFYAHRETGCKTGSWAHLMAFARAIESAYGIDSATSGART